MIYPIDWQRTAACRSEDPDLFFPPPAAGPTATQVAQAKAVCAGCPVRLSCLYLALENGLDHGIFGGFTERERRTLIRRDDAVTTNEQAAARARSGLTAPAVVPDCMTFVLTTRTE